MDEFLRNREARKFAGRPISLKVRDADLSDVFRLVGETSGFNIVMSENVKGKVTLAMEGVPWDQVLDVILRTHQLGAERNVNLLRIATLQDLTSEKNQELQAQKATEAVAPRVTKIFSISYANIDDLSKLLANFTQSGSNPSAAGPISATGTVVQADKRTNQIIVRDTAENIDKMKKLVELLDTQTPQVMIEAKVVEASESFSKSIGGNVGVGINPGSSGKTQAFTSFNANNPTSDLVGDAGVFKDGSAIATAGGTSGGSIFGLSPRLAFAPNLTLNALLNMAENESTIKVVSAPKTVVLDREQANILESTPVSVPVVTVSAAGSGGGTEIKDANLSMQVTPSVTNEGSVLMQLTLSRDIPQAASGPGNLFGIAKRSMTTKVLVDSGSTLVIGGIYTMSTENRSSGFPGLRKIPLIGFLFGSESDTTAKSELFFFITPRVLNPREAGLGG